MRLDLTVNILTNHAINNGRITVFGGDQLRPNIHVEDMTDLYVMLLEEPDEAINGKTWNAGYHNLKVRTIADMVREQVGPKRRYRGDADATIIAPIMFRRKRSGATSVSSLRARFKDAIVDLEGVHSWVGKVPNAMTDDRYYNIKRMQSLKLR